MMTGLRNASAAGANAIRRIAGEQVTYKRGLATVAIKAATADNTFEIAESDGQIVTWHGRDFWIRAEDLVLNNQSIIPQRGDHIIDSDGRVFEVNAPADAKVFRYADPYYLELRIHTKEIG